MSQVFVRRCEILFQRLCNISREKLHIVRFFFGCCCNIGPTRPSKGHWQTYIVHELNNLSSTSEARPVQLLRRSTCHSLCRLTAAVLYPPYRLSPFFRLTHISLYILTFERFFFEGGKGNRPCLFAFVRGGIIRFKSTRIHRYTESAPAYVRV